MYSILSKEFLNPSVCKMQVLAPQIAKKAQPGQFVIVRAKENSERIPLTIMDYAPLQGSISIVFQLVGGATMQLASLLQGQAIADVAGPLGRPSVLHGLKKVAVVGGGVGCAIAYPIAKKLWQMKAQVNSIVGFRTAGLVILEKEFSAVSTVFKLMTDDGSRGEKGLVTTALSALIESGHIYDEVVAIGPLIMMKHVVIAAKAKGIKTTVSMNPLMIDGTGMCGCCRLSVGGKTQFACVDGPDFDGYLVDFDEAIKRSGIYKSFEEKARDESCNLLAQQ